MIIQSYELSASSYAHVTPRVGSSLLYEQPIERRTVPKEGLNTISKTVKIRPSPGSDLVSPRTSL